MSFHPKSITDLRSGAGKRRSGQRSPMTTLARFFEPPDFRLLQQYRHLTDISSRANDVSLSLQSGHRSPCWQRSDACLHATKLTLARTGDGALRLNGRRMISLYG